ncbi:hypothetical protein [Cupriavidus numazuensis]|uniref:Uncharacterized protein n=1 Tax=Cupriavidus numazuensis TaxID=221992 RepID=A0ABM8TAU2_9BURK|nr:hypothetical protein [Cupriavidus numazuensis]CAG2132311.1 hypothetical protein LMG26411_00594 [Cupriavidus numazuensis]
MTPSKNEVAVNTTKPLTEHDLEHRNMRLQLFVLRQLLLKSYAEQYGDRAQQVIAERLATVSDAAPGAGMHAAEQALLIEESAEVFADIDEHLALIQADAL